MQCNWHMNLKHLENQSNKKGVIRMKILIVEDDASSRKFLQKFLSKYGECDAVVDGLEALEAFIISINDEKPYDLVCLDLMMPKVDGVATLKAIRDLERQKKVWLEDRVKVIITTALDDQEFVKKALELGCDLFISKPIDIHLFTKGLVTIGLIPQEDRSV